MSNKFLKNKTNITFWDILSRTFGLIFTILVFVISVYLAGIDFKTPFVLAFLSLLGGLLFDRFASIGTDFKGMKDSQELIEGLKNEIRNSFNVECIESDRAISDYMSDRMKSAINVTNTFVGLGEPSRNADSASKSVLDLYRSFFSNNGKIWTDAVSINELTGPRYRSISIAAQSEPDHRIVLLRHSIPVLNFTIIDFGSGRKEVLFGWNYSTRSASKNLFLSDETELIRSFESYFESLEKYKTEEFKIDYSAQIESEDRFKKRKFVDRSGEWITIGFDGKKVVSVAHFKVLFMQHQAEITGIAHWTNKYPDREQKFGIEEFQHDSTDVSYADKKIFLEYAANSSRRRGICVYNFKKRNGEDRLEGYMQDEGQENRVQLIGYRLCRIENPSKPIERELNDDLRQRAQELAHAEGLLIDWSEFGSNEKKAK